MSSLVDDSALKTELTEVGELVLQLGKDPGWVENVSFNSSNFLRKMGKQVIQFATI